MASDTPRAYLAPNSELLGPQPAVAVFNDCALMVGELVTREMAWSLGWEERSHEGGVTETMPRPPDEKKAALEPWTGISHDEAEKLAALRGMRLPTLEEWQAIVSTGLIHPVVWEWTSTPSKGGFAVCGGAWRNQDSTPSVENVSWEDSAAPDVGFRCVRALATPSGLDPRLEEVANLAADCVFCGGAGATLEGEHFFEGQGLKCACGAYGVHAMNPMDLQDAVFELLDEIDLKLVEVVPFSSLALSAKKVDWEAGIAGSTVWLRTRVRL